VILCETVAVVEKSGKFAPLKDMEKMKPLMQMVFHCIDKMKRMKLSKEVIYETVSCVSSITLLFTAGLGSPNCDVISRPRDVSRVI